MWTPTPSARVDTPYHDTLSGWRVEPPDVIVPFNWTAVLHGSSFGLRTLGAPIAFVGRQYHITKARDLSGRQRDSADPAGPALLPPPSRLRSHGQRGRARAADGARPLRPEQVAGGRLEGEIGMQHLDADAARAPLAPSGQPLGHPQDPTRPAVRHPQKLGAVRPRDRIRQVPCGERPVEQLGRVAPP